MEPITEAVPGKGYIFRCARKCAVPNCPCPKCGMALSPPGPVPSTHEWVSMHEVVQDEPGLSKMRYDLEPRTVTIERGESGTGGHAAALLDRVGADHPVAVSAMGMHTAEPLICLRRMNSRGGWKWSSPHRLCSGPAGLFRSLRPHWFCSLNMFTLIGLGVGVAYIYSIVAKLFRIFPASFRSEKEAVAVLRGRGRWPQPWSAGPGA
jgi:Cu+-exporting ATPase